MTYLVTGKKWHESGSEFTAEKFIGNYEMIVQLEFEAKNDDLADEFVMRLGLQLSTIKLFKKIPYNFESSE